MAFIFKIRDMITPRSKVLEEISLKEGITVLDYGSGPGGYIGPTLDRIGPDGIYYAADIHQRAGVHAERIARRKGRDRNVFFIKTDRDTGLRSSSVDVIYLFDTYHDLPDGEGILKELKRILKKNGCLLFNDHHIKGELIKNDGPLNKHFKIVKEGRSIYTLKKK